MQYAVLLLNSVLLYLCRHYRAVTKEGHPVCEKPPLIVWTGSVLGDMVGPTWTNLGKRRVIYKNRSYVCYFYLFFVLNTLTLLHAFEAPGLKKLVEHICIVMLCVTCCLLTARMWLVSIYCFFSFRRAGSWTGCECTTAENQGSKGQVIATKWFVCCVFIWAFFEAVICRLLASHRVNLYCGWHCAAEHLQWRVGHKECSTSSRRSWWIKKNKVQWEGFLIKVTARVFFRTCHCSFGDRKCT